MTLEIKKLCFSSRHGYTVEFEKPGTVSLTFKEAYSLMVFLKGHLTEAELNREFETKEQEIILRYVELCFQKMDRIAAEYREAGTVEAVTSELKRVLHWWMACTTDEKKNLYEHFLGWKVPEPQPVDTMDHRIQRALKAGHYDKHYFANLLKEKSWGQPKPKTMKALEKRYGPFNLDSI